MERPWTVVAGGGTAGHLMPGLAVADALVDMGRRKEEIRFVGSRHGLEAKLLESTGYPYTLLPGRGVQRSFAPGNLIALAGLATALLQAVFLMIRGRPRVVLALGGYASLACAVGAVLLRIPLVVAEQNARSGLANRLVGRFAKACAVAFENTDLPHAVHTGNPVRPALLGVHRPQDTSAAREVLGIPSDRVVIGVFSGSLGSRRINLATLEMIDLLGDRGDLAIYHVIGSRDFDELSAVLPKLQGERDPGLLPQALGVEGPYYRAVRYEERMDLLLAAADIVVSRAGGTTVAELSALGVPSILVPLPIATRDHQRANAEALVESGAAILVDDSELDGHRLHDVILEIVDAPGRLAEMASTAALLGRRGAAAEVAELMERYAK